MSSLFYKTVLDEFSRSMDMPPLAFDDKGACNMIIDKSFLLTLLCDDTHQRLLLVGLLEPSDDIPLQRLLAGALNPLVNAGPGIGWDEHTDLYHAYQSISQEKVSVSTLRCEIAGMVEWMKCWRTART
ncbi:type III chaperone protein ShcA [Pseudomonas syringae]|uniref:type III secretion system chaperone n=1 Tax=Pseudomonas syringae TaxID=317 RepID=UPI001F45AAC0|nr:type III secretion system chaperone [Pseudomonas syringae]MCF5708733.1 type III chaperone protein ShcA [Pseudomonas syringae]